MQRQMMNDEINNLYRDYKQRKPEIQQMYENSMEDLQKRIQESMKEKKTTIWDVITQVNIIKNSLICFYITIN